MTKLDKLKQAEHLYVYEKQPLDVIGAKLDLSRRTLFYMKILLRTEIVLRIIFRLFNQKLQV